MSKAEILDELPKLTPEERREIRLRLSELDDEWEDEGELTAEEKQLVEKRLIEHERNPKSAIPWAEFEGRIKARPGE